ncbi:3-keto-disaccharide hydrolase [Allorhodopirellula solitaria]|uniref:3-keto-alpha-glucoside-1,2-lyase/3-keto-2-hydroxy-glucal hydratase domain-containing protein n=1 Tax=Allorhodopirellula solitaria TaxID=2527987 RepID=A0A5C5YDE1_9BACT|nr:DUF1080 domain-containing protein [Allorhodopirellula solitaria]TWT72978.1 hypothetical protein CA85_14390 [Allorhodopirellula solitaria]
MTTSSFCPRLGGPSRAASFILSVSLLALLIGLPTSPAFGQDTAADSAGESAETTDEASDETQDGGDAEPAENSEPEKADESKSGEGESKPADDGEKPSEPTSEDAAADAAQSKDAESEPVADPEWVAKGVWTLPPTEGPAAIDFSLVGEYVGDLGATQADGDDSADESAESSDNNRLGVQIRNLGDGEFEARAYSGGLPGQEGYVNEKPMVLLGRRSGKTLVLSGGPWAMFASPDGCKIIDVTGSTLAELERVERRSPTLGAAAPDGATVLFDGSDTSAFSQAEMNEQGLLQQGADIREMLSDFDLHLEFRIPHMPKMTGQKRGNSGLYLQGRYECQVLDSFGEEKVFNGLGALYRYKTPKINMAFPPLVWQTYDIHFTAARYAADGSKVRNARVTSWINGVKVQDDQELTGPTGAGQDETPTLLPTKIQNHGDPVRFRNIWVIDRGLTGGIQFPQMAK